AIIGWIELFLGKWGQEQSHPVHLHRRQNVLEQHVEVRQRHDLTARHISQFRPILKKNRRRKLRQKCFGQIKIHIKSLQARERRDYHLRKNKSARGVLGMRQGGIGKGIGRADLLRRHRRKFVPRHSLGEHRRW